MQQTLPSYGHCITFTSNNKDHIHDSHWVCGMSFSFLRFVSTFLIYFQCTIFVFSFHLWYSKSGRWIRLYDWAKATSWLKLANHTTISFERYNSFFDLIIPSVLCDAMRRSFISLRTCIDTFFILLDFIRQFYRVNNRIE